MDDNQLLAICWKCCTTAVCILVVSVASCTVNTHLAVSRDLQHGTDPVAVSCAHNNDDTHTMCAILAAKR